MNCKRFKRISIVYDFTKSKIINNSLHIKNFLKTNKVGKSQIENIYIYKCQKKKKIGKNSLSYIVSCKNKYMKIDFFYFSSLK